MLILSTILRCVLHSLLKKSALRYSVGFIPDLAPGRVDANLSIWYVEGLPKVSSMPLSKFASVEVSLSNDVVRYTNKWARHVSEDRITRQLSERYRTFILLSPSNYGFRWLTALSLGALVLLLVWAVFEDNSCELHPQYLCTALACLAVWGRIVQIALSHASHV